MSAASLDPKTRIPTWKAEDAINRVQACAFFLKMHDFLTDGERRKVHERMLKWVTKHGYSYATPRPEAPR